MNVQEVKERIKTHYEEHKIKYAFVGGATFAVITVLIMRRQSIGGCNSATKEWSGRNSTTKPQSIVSSPFSNSFNTTNNYDRIRPLSYIVSELGTDNWWPSQADLSRDTGISEPLLSNHINHGAPLASGKTYIRRGVAA